MSSNFLKCVIIALLLMVIGAVAVLGYVFINVLSPKSTNNITQSNTVAANETSKIDNKTVGANETPKTDNTYESIQYLNNFDELIDFLYDKRGVGTKNDRGVFPDLRELAKEIALSDLIGTTWYTEIGLFTDDYDYKNMVLMFGKSQDDIKNTILFTYEDIDHSVEQLAGYFELQGKSINIEYENLILADSSDNKNYSKIDNVTTDYKLELSADGQFLHVCFNRTDSSGNDRYITFRKYTETSINTQDEIISEDYIFDNITLLENLYAEIKADSNKTALVNRSSDIFIVSSRIAAIAGYSFAYIGEYKVEDPNVIISDLITNKTITVYVRYTEDTDTMSLSIDGGEWSTFYKANDPNDVMGLLAEYLGLNAE